MPDLEGFLRLWRALDGLFGAEERTRWGAVVSDARYPDVQETNYARVETTRPVTLAAIEAALLPAIAGVGCHREHVVVFFPEAQTDLLVEASGRGERLVWDLVMARAGTPPRPARDGADDVVEEVLDRDEAFWRAHRATARLFGATDDGVLDQLSALERDVLIPAGRRWFAVRDADGAPQALAALLILQGVAFVDHVATFPEVRRRGYATALTRRLLREASTAGAESTFLMADPEGRAAGIYDRLGFERVTQIASWIAPLEGGRPARRQRRSTTGGGR